MLTEEQRKQAEADLKRYRDLHKDTLVAMQEGFVKGCLDLSMIAEQTGRLNNLLGNATEVPEDPADG